ncbi:hypothetical protein CASFOL_003870 [Castilleja foliolosa]|uniref:Germin-like protein n=1 Tax=Castilleja foliolosa TaxID=1961234 RepID=A0ABD3ELS4_9LAMI
MASTIIYLSLIIIINFLITIAFAFDPTPLQDFCVADLTSQLSISGPLPCKDPKSVTADNFYYTGLNKPGDTSNKLNAGLTPVGVKQVPGLNTLGLSMARLDLGPGGYFPLHVHARASEIHIVLQGSLEVGFTSPEHNYTYYSKTLNVGDMFVVPAGLIHVQRNPGNVPMSSYSILNSQNPGVDEIGKAIKNLPAGQLGA